ncbi:MAG TPA: GNAT family N-acetyltransferase [Hyphomonas sp.]|nr:GNAT family N-acetyltransferase [Hyphomonas sp.]HPE48658.1 GNAT family N-acetyltransferase [Hyphomonas sp.]
MAIIGPTLETERLILRPPKAEDFPFMCEMMADAETARFIGGVMEPSAVWRSLCVLTGAWTIRGYSMFSVIEKSTGNWIGRLGPWQPEGWPGTEIAYGLTKGAQGRGYAREGVSAAIDYAVDILGWDEVIHCIDPLNAPSIRLAESLGARKLREAQAPAPFAEIRWDVYGQSADDWRARRG